MPSSGVSPASMKPVISANMRPAQAALRASSTWPPWSEHSTMAASTGVGLFQCVKPQWAQRRRSLGPPSSSCVTNASAFAHCGQ